MGKIPIFRKLIFGFFNPRISASNKVKITIKTGGNQKFWVTVLANLLSRIQCTGKIVKEFRKRQLLEKYVDRSLDYK